MWRMKTEIIPVVIGALGLNKKGLEKHKGKIPGTITINELQKLTRHDNLVSTLTLTKCNLPFETSWLRLCTVPNT